MTTPILMGSCAASPRASGTRQNVGLDLRAIVLDGVYDAFAPGGRGSPLAPRGTGPTERTPRAPVIRTPGERANRIWETTGVAKQEWRVVARSSGGR